MDIFNISKGYKITKKDPKWVFFSYYKSEKSAGNSSILSILVFVHIYVELFQKIWLQISSIFSNILFGWAYCSTSSPKSPQSIGNKNMVNTVTTIPITAYLIVLIAGFILSSFPQESISKRPHHKMKTIENIPAAKTNIDIAIKTNSQKSSFSHNID